MPARISDSIQREKLQSLVSVLGLLSERLWDNELGKRGFKSGTIIKNACF